MESETSTRSRSLIWLYLVAAVAILGLVVWTSLRTLRDSPNREASVDLPGMGFVTVQFSTDPSPPLPSGTVQLNFMPANSRNVMVDLGPALPFAYGYKGSETPVGSGQAVLDSMGMNYQAGVQFPGVGDYWVAIDVGGGEEVRFQFYVEPAQ
jgi:hypothetical protein